MQRETPSEALRDSERLLEAATRRSERTQLRCEMQSTRRSLPSPPVDDEPTLPDACPIPFEDDDPQRMTVANWPANDEG
jgi:hypothetical protein